LPNNFLKFNSFLFFQEKAPIRLLTEGRKLQKLTRLFFCLLGVQMMFSYTSPRV